MSNVVIDASAVGALLLPDEGGEAAHLARHHLQLSTVMAPRHFPIEVLSLIVKAYRRKRIEAADRDKIIDLAQRLTARVALNGELSLSRIAQLADREGLSVYDAAYLDLALKNDARLISCDGKLSRAASRLGIVARLP